MVKIKKKVFGKIYQITMNLIPCTHKSKLNILKRFILKKVFRHIGENVNIRPKIKFANGYNTIQHPILNKLWITAIPAAFADSPINTKLIT